ncbi:MAG: LytTR family DNA-binding domain-containing protein [Bacteroidia bacterium]|nr:LytTR family DNA-binding domain-containing protein [Bacteroidia bacterium]
MQNFLKRPFAYLDPMPHRILLALFCSVFAAIFLNIFEPFDLDSWTILKNYKSRFPILLFSLTGFLFLGFTQIVLRKLFKIHSFNIGGFSLWFAGELILLSILNHNLFGDAREDFGEMMYEFSLTFKYTSLVLLIPYFISLLYFSSKSIEIPSEEKEKISSPDKETGINQVHFQAENEREVLSIKLDHLLFLKSESNYVAIFYLYNGQLKKRLIRNSLKKLEQELKPPTLIRVHRSYMLNILNAVSVTRNPKSYQVFLEKAEEYPIPVSPTYMENFDERLKELNN